MLARKMVRGKLDQLVPGSFNIVLGRELALWLGVGVGDSVVVTTSDFRSTPMGAIATQKRFIVSGVFEAGYNEFDKGLAVVNMKDLQRVLRIGEGVTGVRLKPPAGDVVKACLDQRLLTVGAGDNVVRLLPPLNVTDAEISEATSRLSKALANVAKASV